MKSSKYILCLSLGLFAVAGFSQAFAKVESFTPTYQQFALKNVNNLFNLSGTNVTVQSQGYPNYVLGSTPLTSNGAYLTLGIVNGSYCSFVSAPSIIHLGLDSKSNIIVTDKPAVWTGKLTSNVMGTCAYKSYTLTLSGDPTTPAGYTLTATFQ